MEVPVLLGGKTTTSFSASSIGSSGGVPFCPLLNTFPSAVPAVAQPCPVVGDWNRRDPAVSGWIRPCPAGSGRVRLDSAVSGWIRPCPVGAAPPAPHGAAAAIAGADACYSRAWFNALIPQRVSKRGSLGPVVQATPLSSKRGKFTFQRRVGRGLQGSWTLLVQGTSQEAALGTQSCSSERLFYLPLGKILNRGAVRFPQVPSVGAGWREAMHPGAIVRHGARKNALHPPWERPGGQLPAAALNV
ncbi:uncharacterized protein LOC120750045 [Hirundo rustica]|uniref:uncharacterized protein LOC120750045 n=1 Tax=Hirundo rustica TaxID=43150 RepID=UPI001A9505DB|nr:uncharacterized protein LOC120750045 [Hirundo rustica]